MPITIYGTTTDYNKLNLINGRETFYRAEILKVVELTETTFIAHDVHINNIRNR